MLNAIRRFGWGDTHSGAEAASSEYVPSHYTQTQPITFIWT